MMSVAIAQRHQVVRNAARHHQAVLDGLVAVAIAERDLVTAHGRHEDQTRFDIELPLVTLYVRCAPNTRAA